MNTCALINKCWCTVTHGNFLIEKCRGWLKWPPRTPSSPEILRVPEFPLQCGSRSLDFCLPGTSEVVLSKIMESSAHVLSLSPSVRWTSLFHYRGWDGVLCDQRLSYPSISRLTMAESHLSGGLLPLSLSPTANKHRLYAEFPYLTTFKSLLILSLHDICTSEFKMRHAFEAPPPSRSTQVRWGPFCRLSARKGSFTVNSAGRNFSCSEKRMGKKQFRTESFDFKRLLPHVKAVMHQ